MLPDKIDGHLFISQSVDQIHVHKHHFPGAFCDLHIPAYTADIAKQQKYNLALRV